MTHSEKKEKKIKGWCWLSNKFCAVSGISREYRHTVITMPFISIQQIDFFFFHTNRTWSLLKIKMNFEWNIWRLNSLFGFSRNWFRPRDFQIFSFIIHWIEWILLSLSINSHFFRIYCEVIFYLKNQKATKYDEKYHGPFDIDWDILNNKNSI